MPMTNTTGKLALFWRFSITASSLPSKLTDHYSLATRFTSHIARPTIVGGRARRRCPAPIWVQHSPPGRSQHATRCYVSGFVPEFAAPCFRRKLMCSIKLRLFLSGLGWTATLDITVFQYGSCAVMGHVAYSPKNRLFEPVSGRFTPIRPTNPRRERHGLPTLATVLPPPASRPTPHQRGEVLCRLSPAGYCLPPTAQLPMAHPAFRGVIPKCMRGGYNPVLGAGIWRMVSH